MDLLTDQAFFRSFHILFGIAWIGLLYYFNFVQTEYVKVADPDAKADVMKKLAPNALWWFRWAALFTFLTGLILLHQITARIGTEIILSWLGLGIQPPRPSLGNMLLEGGSISAIRAVPWMLLAPGIVAWTLVLTWNLFGDSLNDVFNPRTR